MESKTVESNDVLVAKIVSMVVVGLCSFLIGILPIKLTKWGSLKSVEGEKNLIISLMLCFGGGVLLYTTFIHLQPEVKESFQILEQNKVLPKIGNGIPIAELVFCLGFFCVYLIEELVHLYLDKRMHNQALHRSLSIRYSGKKTDNMTIPRVTLTKFDDGNISYISNSNKELFDSQTTVNVEKQGHSHGQLDDSIKNSFSGFLAVLALSFHAVFEGLAVGLEPKAEKVWYLFGAIATHKFVIGFCVGVELVTSKTRALLVMVYIGTFAIVTPLGIGIGIILIETEGAGDNVVALVLQGMAAGTLLYVVFFEVLSREKDNRHSGVAQLLAILAGFAVMLALQMLLGQEHSHGGQPHNHDHHHKEPADLTNLHSHNDAGIHFH